MLGIEPESRGFAEFPDRDHPNSTSPQIPLNHHQPSSFPLNNTMAFNRLTAQAIRAAPRFQSSFVRTYAAQATSGIVKPPVALYGVDGTYATALVSQFPRYVSVLLDRSGGCGNLERLSPMDEVKPGGSSTLNSHINTPHHQYPTRPLSLTRNTS